jgi:hypothetical protein
LGCSGVIPDWAAVLVAEYYSDEVVSVTFKTPQDSISRFGFWSLQIETCGCDERPMHEHHVAVPFDKFIWVVGYAAVIFVCKSEKLRFQG